MKAGEPMRSLLVIMSLFVSHNIHAMIESELFFNTIIGVSEKTFLQWYAEPAKLNRIKNILHFDAEKAIFYLKNLETNKQYQAGFFQTYSIKELRNIGYAKKGNGSFNVIEGKNIQNSTYKALVDINALQADPTNYDALFQVVSSAYALKPFSIPFEHGVTPYIADFTQGALAQVSAAPGLIYRMYYLFYNEHIPAHEWLQTDKHHINLLGNSGIHGEKGMADYLKADTFIEDAICIGYHRDVQVTYGAINKNCRNLVTDNQIINQSLVTAIDLSSINSDLASHEKLHVAAKQMIKAAYEGTLRVAAIHNKKKVFLTLAGGGLFKNPLAWIAEALHAMYDFIVDAGLEVFLIIYDSEHPNIKEQMPQFRRMIQVLVEKSKGKYTTIDEGIY